MKAENRVSLGVAREHQFRLHASLQAGQANYIKMMRLYKYARRRAARLRQKLWNLRFWPRLRRSPVAALKHLLFDVELDNYTYPIANAKEIAPFLSAATGVPEAN